MSFKNVLLINDTRFENHVGSNQVISNIIDYCDYYDMKVIGTLTRKEVENWIPRINKRLQETDTIIINGEGSLHDDPKWFSILNRNVDKFKNHKVVLINSVWQNMSIYKKIFDKCSLITFRESYSYNEFIKNYGDSDKVSVVPDIIFTTHLNQQHIGFGDSVVKEVNDMLNEKNYFPMNYQYNEPKILAYYNWLRSLKLYVTGRYHGCCLAILAKTQFNAIKSNTHKIEGLLSDLDLTELMIKDKTQISMKVNPIEFANKCNDYLSEAKLKINDLFKEISEL